MYFLTIFLKFLVVLQSAQSYSSKLYAIDHRKVLQGENKNYKPFTYRIIHIPKISNGYKPIYSSAVILIKDLDEVEEFNTKVFLANDYPEKLKFIIVPERSSEGIVLKYIPIGSFQGYIPQFEYYLVNKALTIELSTFEYFTKDACVVNQIPLNKFDKIFQKWENKLNYEEKFMNFNNCEMPIVIHSNNSQDAYYSNGELKGFFKDFGDILGQRGNFKAIYKIVDLSIEFENNVESMVDRIYHKIFLYEAYYSTLNKKSGHITRSFIQFQQIFALSQSEAYDSYEKLILPFDETTWYLLIITFGSAFAIIFLARFASQSMRDRFFGRGISSPAFNVIRTFFGIGQIRLPVESIPRFILMMFILFCLIIRTAYQGVLFDMMTKDMRKSQPKTIADLKMQNYTVIVWNHSFSEVDTYLNLFNELFSKDERF
jgi:hypothetical protein